MTDKLPRPDSYPLCRRMTCKANSRGRCRILTDNDFGKKRCPFYKPKEASHV